MPEIVQAQTTEGETVEYDRKTPGFDPSTSEGRPIVKPTRQLIAELTARVEAAEARIAALESAAKV